MNASIKEILRNKSVNEDSMSDESGGELLLKISVCDEGVGISPEKITQIFEPFG